MRHGRLRGLAGVVGGVAVLSGCAALQTEPGNPQSTSASLFSDSHYSGRVSDLSQLTWPTTRKAYKDHIGDDAASRGTPPPPDYLASDKPFEIWQVRGTAWNRSLEYRAAAWKAGEVQNLIAIPLFGAAIAGAAVAIGGSGTAAIAASGLAGTSIYGGYTYLHPAQDAITDREAAGELRCVVDQSKPLLDMSVVTLVLDKASLQDALDQLEAQDSGLKHAPTLRDADKKIQDAVVAVQEAAGKVMDNLNAAIKAYNELPAQINLTIDRIDDSAQTSGARVLDYGTILSSLKSSAKADASTMQAGKEVAAAGAAAADVKTKSRTAGSGAAAEVLSARPLKDATSGSSVPAGGSNLSALTVVAADGARTMAIAGSDQEPAAREESRTKEKIAVLARSLNDVADPMDRVVRIGAHATQDIPAPNYTEVLANIQACNPTAPAGMK